MVNNYDRSPMVGEQLWYIYKKQYQQQNNTLHLLIIVESQN